jgi:hypothetical protein
MRKEQPNVVERLQIENFISIGHFDWYIKDFNVLTGGIAAGKSLCIKLAYFFESILYKVLSFATQDTFSKENFYAKIAEEFNKIFHSQNPEKDYCGMEIMYTFKGKKWLFDLSVVWDISIKKLRWKSKYIDKHIDNIWYKIIKNKNVNASIDNVRKTIMTSIYNEFLGYFPITTTFMPATRAIASVIKENKSKKKDEKSTTGILIKDPFLNDFIYNNRYINAILQSANKDILFDINALLRLNNMSIYTDPATKEKTILFETTDQRIITQLEMSSGQQELIFLLLTISNLFAMTYLYGNDKFHFFTINNLSVFIEEPSTHLFPQEQKITIEFIVRNYRVLKDDKKINTRFFITTHSPYALNVINNMLFKGKIVKDNPEQLEKINKKIKFPHLFSDEITASFIQDKEKCKKPEDQCRNMIDNGRKLIFAGEIADISYAINKDTNDLEDIKELIDSKGKENVL